MGISTVNGASEHLHELGALAASIPGMYLAKKDLAGASATFERLAAAAGAGSLPVSESDPRVDGEGTLWLICAAHLYARAGGDKELSTKLLEISKRGLQEFISAKGLGGITMDNGGMLVPGPEQSTSDAIRLNSLWYSALESTAADLGAVKPGSGDHFERLAGRFRRTFAKSHWCDCHNCVCPPHVRDNGKHGELPSADQLLLTMLPASPVPRTKQRQLVQAVREKTVTDAKLGVLVIHKKHGVVESTMHRAWMAMGIVNSADNRAAGVAEAQTIIKPLAAMISTGGVAAFYRNGAAVGEGVDMVATAELTCAMEQVGMLG